MQKGKMKPILAILALITSFSLFGQEKQVENLVNQVYKEIVPAQFEYFNLIDSSSITSFGKSDIKQKGFKEFLIKHPDFPVEYFLKRANDSIRINWNNYHLEKARIYTSKTIPRFYSQVRHFTLLIYSGTSKQKLDSLEKNREYDEAFVLYKKWWSQKRIKNEIKKTWTRYESKIRKENKLCFSFSNPIISENELYAMIVINQGGAGATYIFKKIDNKWIKILSFNGWIS